MTSTSSYKIDNKLIQLLISYQSAVILNDEAVKFLMDINEIINEKENENKRKEELLENELNRKIRLLNLRTRIINSQIDKKIKKMII